MTTEYEDLIGEYADAKAAVEQAHRKLSAVTAELTAWMQAMGRKTLKASRDGYLMQATYTQQTTVKIDETGLRKKLGAKEFDRYTVRKLDRKRFEEALDAGEIDAVKVIPFVTTKKSDPFIKFTVREDVQEDK